MKEKVQAFRAINADEGIEFGLPLGPFKVNPVIEKWVISII